MKEINLAVCRMCGTILHSKHSHDFVACGCPNLSAVDGGPGCKRRLGKDLKMVVDCITMAEARRLSAGFKEKIKKDKPVEVKTVLAIRFADVQPGQQFKYCTVPFLKIKNIACLGNVAGHHTDSRKAAQAANCVNMFLGEVFHISDEILVEPGA